MKEDLRHQKIFDTYYTTGKSRSLKETAKKFGIAERTIKGYSSEFNWKERIVQRDIENSKRLEKKTDTAVVNEKARYQVEIRAAMGPLKHSINRVVQKIKKFKMVEGTADEKNAEDVLMVETVVQYERLVAAYEKLVKLDLLLLGESTERIDVNAGLLDKMSEMSVEDLRKIGFDE